MFSKLKQWNLLAQYEKEEDRRMARVQLNIIAFNCFLSLIVLFVNLIIWRGKSLTIILILGYVLHLILFVLVIKKHLPASSLMLTSAYVLMVTTIATIGGGLHDYVVMMYPVVIMYAALTAQKRGLIFAAILTFAGLGWLVFGEIFGWFVITISLVTDQTDLFVSLILITLAVWMVHILISNMEYGLTQTWRELAERRRIENELRKLTPAVEQSPASIIITDLNGNIEYVNPRFTQITGYGFDEVIGKNPRILKTEKTPSETYSHLWETITAGKEWRGEFTNRKKDGSLYYESAIISPITDLNEVVTHYLAVKEDITERKQMEETMRESERFARSVVDSLSTQVVILDESGSIVAVNRVWRELAESQMPEPAAICEGANYLAICDVTHGADALYAAAVAAGIRAVIRGVQTAFSLEYPCGSDATKMYWYNVNVTRFAGDGLIRVVVAHEDITERKQAEALQQDSLDRLRKISSHVPGMVCQYRLHPDGSSCFPFASDAINTIYRVSPEDVREDASKVFANLHPDDYANVAASIQKSAQNLSPWQSEYRVRFDDGAIRLLYGDALPQREDDGSVLWHGFITDITERKQAEEALQEMRSRLHLLGDNLEEAALYVYSHDTNGQPHFEYLSAGMEKLTGVKIEDVLQDASRLHSLLLPEYISSLIKLEEKSRQDLMGFEMETRQRHAVTGNIRWTLLRSTPRRRPNGSTVWYGVQIDITERKRSEKLLKEANEQLNMRVKENEQLQAKLREQAIRDPLTGLFNRRYLNETLEREIVRAGRENVPLSVIMADVDHFKMINDTYGHPVGDKFLVEIASLLKSHARGSDIVSRYGGEEFLLVLPGTALDSAARRAEEIRQKCAEIIIQHEGKDLKVTMSFGVATYPAHGKDAEEIIIKADKALYRAKAQGRNCTVIFE